MIVYSNTRTVQKAEFPEISHFLNQHHSSLARHVDATRHQPGSIFTKHHTETIIPRRIRSDEELTLETSASESLYGGQFTSSCNTPTERGRSTTVSLKTYLLYSSVV